MDNRAELFPALRRSAAMAAKWPAFLVRLIAGGGKVTIAGRVLDPHFQLVGSVNKRRQGGRPLALASFRKGTDLLPFAVSEPLSLNVSYGDREIAGPRGPVAIRIYSPQKIDPTQPAFVFYHFGGGVIGSILTCEWFCGVLAEQLASPVISVDYRLAPEFPFPAGLEDCLCATRWARDNSASLGAKADSIAIGGDSMGGNFAAVICQILRDNHEAQPELQLLLYPGVDLADERQSLRDFARSFPLGEAELRFFLARYIRPSEDPATNPLLSPLRAKDLRGLAPAFIVTAGHDPLVDQGQAYADALKAAGNRVYYRMYESLSHGFTAFSLASPASKRACLEIARDMIGFMRQP